MTNDDEKLEVLGHSVETDVDERFGVTIWCTRPDCYLEVVREPHQKATQEFISLAEDYPCPSGYSSCVICDRPIDPTGEICHDCYGTADIGECVSTNTERIAKWPDG
jgi:hypothetical protein